ncbi:hypothetical protein IQ276_011935 [Desmonostoc muscorum LEGE 12446]|uniref:Uncharacterized protein n=1 Tax=Desmonostoc muscorum LEGE 12446 TaxID=1828758 RepID=A0A8J6ZZ10_DESMC|nr:hypothetical protein [Desmonostoc muscorum]MCF2147144.1 hypothetical protein [Desmonostoc muscorum LEGE 12446]
MLQTGNLKSEIYEHFHGFKVIEVAKRNAGLQDVHNTEYLLPKIRNSQSVLEVDKILKTCVFQGKGIHPRKFCRRWFGLEDLDDNRQPYYTEKLILAIESEHGYREKCIKLIAKVLKIKPNTVHRWGKGVEFDKIPSDKREQYETYLSYVDSLRAITLNIAGSNEDLLVELLHCLEFK